MTKTTALEKALRQERATEDAIDLLIKDFDLDSLVVKDGAIQDADKLLKSVKEKRPNLFIKETVEGTPPPDGARSDQATGADDTIKRLMGIK